MLSSASGRRMMEADSQPLAHQEMPHHQTDENAQKLIMAG